MSRPVTKWNRQVRSADEVAATVRRAIEVATGGRPGPVLVDVPKDVQLAPLLGAPQPAPRAAAGRPGGGAAAARRPRARRRPDVHRAPAGALRRRRPGQLGAGRLRGVRPAGRPPRRPVHADADGAGRLPGVGRALPRHARHARHAGGQPGDAQRRPRRLRRRALRRPRDRPARRVLPRRAQDPRRHRPGQHRPHRQGRRAAGRRLRRGARGAARHARAARPRRLRASRPGGSASTAGARATAWRSRSAPARSCRSSS